MKGWTKTSYNHLKIYTEIRAAFFEEDLKRVANKYGITTYQAYEVLQHSARPGHYMRYLRDTLGIGALMVLGYDKQLPKPYHNEVLERLGL